MKKIITLIFLFVCTISFGQNFEKRAERVKALRVAFISNKLDLTSQEAEKFWPIFNKFSDSQMDLHKQKRKLMLKLKPENTVGMSDTATLKLLNESEDIDADMENKKRQFVKDLQGVIPPQKILLLKKTEEEFKSTLLKKLNDRRNGPPPRN
ncbi:sensor of ECF-type sigma factor [Flavobacterium sp.]|uniref:sensor of ECF-type sigma factor n=1 Tax=Flavobacterium sp. TaxID=239 RepID=UPI0037530AD3